MALLRRIGRRLRALFRRSRIDRELDEEMRLHLELRAEQLRRGGASAGDSQQAARRRFGSPLRLREEGLDSWGSRWLEQLLQDLRFAMRTLARHPGYALTAILTLALGIGANTAMFSVLNGVVLKPLPYANGDRLVLIRQSAPGRGVADAGVSVREFYDYRDRAHSFDALVEYHQMYFDLLRRGAPDRVDVGVVAHNFFPVLGIAPLLGRGFMPADDAPGAAAVLLLSHSYWMTRFGSDPRIVGQVFEMNDRPHTVVGVLPDVPHYPQENDVYMPIASCPFRARAEQQSGSDRRAFQILHVFGRLKPDVTPQAAGQEIDAICGGFIRAHPAVYAPSAGFAATTPAVRAELVRDARPLLLILLGATGLVLLIACANVASLTLARLLRRDRELGLREALGAGRGRLVRQLLTESTLLSAAGGAVGLLLAAPAISLLTAFVARFTSRTGEIAIDGRVLAFTLGVAILTGIVSGTAPALTSRGDLGALLRAGRLVESRQRQRFQRGLVAAQVAVSVVLLAGAGLLLASFYRLQQVDPGYRSEQVLSAEAFITFGRHATADRQQLAGLYQTIVDRLEAEPGVVSAAATSRVPLTGSPQTVRIRIEGRAKVEPADLPAADATIASPRYFATLGIPLLAGRTFDDRNDRSDTLPVAVVNSTMARQWPQGRAVGGRVSLDNGATWRTVVGVVGDVRQLGLDRTADAQVFVPLSQGPSIAGRLLVRTTTDPATAAAAITAAVHATDPDLPVENIYTLDELRLTHLSPPLLTAVLLTIFAALALVVTMAGIAGVMATHVSHRRREFGVRLALGARRAQVLRPVVCDGLCLVGFGLLGGIAAAAVLTRVLSSYLFATTPTDPLTFAAVIVGLLVAGSAACLAPAWRATRFDPQVIFRSE